MTTTCRFSLPTKQPGWQLSTFALYAIKTIAMSRSKRKTPITGITTATSEKQDKRIANRQLRRCVKQLLDVDPETEVLPLEREVSNVWSMDKDGKIRFDPACHPDLMLK